MVRHHEFDVAEMSLSTYVASLDSDPAPFVALPVFTSRMFRHGGIYVLPMRGSSHRQTCAESGRAPRNSN